MTEISDEKNSGLVELLEVVEILFLDTRVLLSAVRRLLELSIINTVSGSRKVALGLVARRGSSVL